VNVLPRFEPMPVTAMPEPPTGPDWLFEVKYDGFRALAYISNRVELVSKKNHTYRRFDRLCKELGHAFSEHEAVLDGEIICTDAEGRPQFYDLLRTRAKPIYAAFDLLWLDGEDLSKRPLIERKAQLQKLVPKEHHAVFYVQHSEVPGTKVLKQVCAIDLEGVVVKRRSAPYGGTGDWFKILNPRYSQKQGRSALFKKKA
jgi:bifunctional non-homologous end joining protein LigD